MDWGEREQFLWTVWANTGNLPPALENKPILSSTLSDVVSAFCFLSAHRSYGMAANPITFTDMVTYANEHLIEDLDDRHRMFFHVSAMDHAYLKASRAKQERESKK